MSKFNLQKQKLIGAWQQLSYFGQFIRPYWKRGIFVLLLTQLSVGLRLVNPYLTKLVIDDAYQNRNLRLFVILAIIGGGVFLFNSFLNHITSYQQGYIKRHADFELKQKIVFGFYDLDLRFFRDSSKGENLYKLHYDISSVAHLLSETFFQALKIIPSFLFTFIIILFLNWQMALMALFLGSFAYLHALFFLKRRRKIMSEGIKRNQSIFARINEALAKMYLIKAAGERLQEQAGLFQQLRQSLAISLRGLRLQITSAFSADLVNKAVIGMIVGFGGYQIITQRMSLGTLTSIMVYLGLIAGYHRQVAFIFEQTGLGLISCERLRKIMDAAEKQRKKMAYHRIAPAAFGPEVLFRQVGFYYYPGQFVFKGFNMQIRPGQSIGLAGRSGCGKSTVLNLLLGLYYPTCGEILIEGIPTNEIDLEFVRRRIGLVLQEPFLWHSSIKDNLLYFNQNGQEADIDRVIEEVRLGEAIKEQPNGLNTNLGDDACKFSEGQKQRLCLGRALLRRPKLLILDEALSFVDNQTALSILKDIRVNYPLMSTLVITHNPQLLSCTEKVFFMPSQG